MVLNKKRFDYLVIIVIGLFLITLSWFDLLEKSAKFMVVPFIAFYQIGQYSERRFKK